MNKETHSVIITLIQWWFQPLFVGAQAPPNFNLTPMEIKEMGFCKPNSVLKP